MSLVIDAIISEWHSMSSHNSAIAIHQTQELNALKGHIARLEETNQRLVDANERILMHLRLLNANDRLEELIEKLRRASL